MRFGMRFGMWFGMWFLDPRPVSKAPVSRAKKRVESRAYYDNE